MYYHFVTQYSQLLFLYIAKFLLVFSFTSSSTFSHSCNLKLLFYRFTSSLHIHFIYISLTNQFHVFSYSPQLQVLSHLIICIYQFILFIVFAFFKVTISSFWTILAFSCFPFTTLLNYSFLYGHLSFSYNLPRLNFPFPLPFNTFQHFFLLHFPIPSVHSGRLNFLL